MGFLILFVLIGVPVAEIWLMIEIGAEIGAPATIALIITTAVIGTLLFRVQGLATLRRVQGSLARDEMPVGELLSGFGLLLAGLLLLVPGFATDLLGLVLFIPPVRRALAGRLLGAARAQGGVFVDLGGLRGRSPQRPGAGEIDGEYEDLTAGDGDGPASAEPPASDRARIDDKHRTTRES